MKTNCVGTLCLNKEVIPKRVKDKNIKKSELIAQTFGPVCPQME
jgi:hypothetical protein